MKITPPPHLTLNLKNLKKNGEIFFTLKNFVTTLWDEWQPLLSPFAHILLTLVGNSRIRRFRRIGKYLPIRQQ